MPAPVTVRAEGLKAAYAVGEPVGFELVVKNTSPGTARLDWPPLVFLSASPQAGGNTVEIPAGGKESVELPPGGEYRRALAWDGRAPNGSSFRPGRYRLHIGRLGVTGPHGSMPVHGDIGVTVVRPPEGFKRAFVPVYATQQQNGFTFSLDRIWLRDDETYIEAHIMEPPEIPTARAVPVDPQRPISTSWSAKLTLLVDGRMVFEDDRGPGIPPFPHIPVSWSADPISASAREVEVVFTVGGGRSARMAVRVPLAAARPLEPEVGGTPAVWGARGPGSVASARGGLCLVHAVVHEHSQAILFLAATGEIAGGGYRYFDSTGREHWPGTRMLEVIDGLWISYVSLQTPLPQAGHLELRLDRLPAMRLVERLRPGPLGPQRIESIAPAAPCALEGAAITGRTAFVQPAVPRAGVIVDVSGRSARQLRLLVDTLRGRVEAVDAAAFAAAERGGR